jgi:hypothetical protein
MWKTGLHRRAVVDPFEPHAGEGKSGAALYCGIAGPRRAELQEYRTNSVVRSGARAYLKPRKSRMSISRR